MSNGVYVHDQLIDGRPFRMLIVIDQFSRLSPLVERRFSFSGAQVAEALDRVISCAAPPESITVDHATEFTSKALEEWGYQRGVKLNFTQPGKPTQNGHIESFNGRLRDECWMSHSSFRSRMLASRSNDGGSITMRIAHTAHLAPHAQ